MTRVVVDEALRAKLDNLTEEKEFCDEAGRTLGHFLPADVYQHLMIELLSARTSEKEIEQLRQEPAGRPLSEIWKSLGQE